MKHTLELHKEYISLQNKPISEMTVYELRVVVIETPSFDELEKAQQELKARGKIVSTYQEDFTRMTGGKLVIEP